MFCECHFFEKNKRGHDKSKHPKLRALSMRTVKSSSSYFDSWGKSFQALSLILRKSYNPQLLNGMNCQSVRYYLSGR